MFLGFEALGYSGIGEAPEDRAAAGGQASGAVDWAVLIYAATKELISRLTDEPANQLFKGTLEKAYRFDRSIIGPDRLGEGVTIGLGEIRLTNYEGDYDFLTVDHTPLGQPVIIRRGDRRLPLATWRTVLSGFMVDQTPDRDAVVFRLRDAGHRLDVPVSPNLYLGTGGIEGGADLKDKRKPRWFGWNYNVTLPLLVSASLVFHVNDGPINSVSAVYVRGVAMSFAADYASLALLTAAALTTGQYGTCLALGLVRIAVAAGTELGEVTADFAGDKTGGTFVATSADIVRRLLTQAADFVDPDELATATFTALNTAQPAPVGYGVAAGSDETVARAVARIMGAIGGWCGSRRSGQQEVRIFSAPAGSPTARYSKINLDDVSTQPLPSDIQTPVWRVRVGYQRNNTVQTNVAGTVSASRRLFLAEPVRFAAAENVITRADFPPGHDLTIDDAFFRDEADAAAEATRRLALFGTSRALYVLKLSERLFMHQLGQVIYVEFARFDLSAGKLLTLAKIVEDDAEGEQVVAFG